MVELSLENLNRLIGISYEAALDPARWQDFVEDLSFMLDGSLVALSGHDFIARQHLTEIVAGIEPDALSAYVDHFAGTNVWVPGTAQLPVGQASLAEAFYERQDLFRTEYYNDWLRPMGHGDAAGIVLHRDRSRFLTLSSHFSFAQAERFGRPLLRALDLLGPHIVRALTVTRRLAQGEAGTIYWQTAENSEHAVMLLDSLGRVVRANGPALALLRDHTAYARAGSGTISLCDAEAQARLDAGLGAIAGNRLVGFDGEFVARGRQGEIIACSLIPLPMRRSHGGALLGQVFDDLPIAVLVLQAQPVSGSMLRTRFGLTPAELALTAALAQGQSLRAYAEARQLSIFTVRAQLKAVFAKTDVHRQSELVALFLRLGGWREHARTLHDMQTPVS